jgi:hypothetical protein
VTANPSLVTPIKTAGPRRLKTDTINTSFGVFHYLVLAVLVFSLSYGVSAQVRGGWILLGESHVDGHNDHDKINVNNHGPFAVLRLHANGAAVKFDHLVVHFENGQSEQVRTSFVVANSSSSPNIPLPGGARNVDSVELWYERASWSNKPVVTLFGPPSIGAFRFEQLK